MTLRGEVLSADTELPELFIIRYEQFYPYTVFNDPFTNVLFSFYFFYLHYVRFRNLMTFLFSCCKGKL